MWVLLEILMLCYCYYAGVLDLHTIVAFFQSFVNAYCEWEKRGFKEYVAAGGNKSRKASPILYSITHPVPPFVNFWRLHGLNEA